MKLDLDDKQLSQFLTTAILDQVSVESREAVLKQAVQDILKPVKYSRDESTEVHKVAKKAVAKCLSDLFEEHLKEDRFRSQLSQICTKFLEEIGKNHSEELARRMATAFVRGLED